MLIEEKSVFEHDLWLRYGAKAREYISGYHLSLQSPNPARWILLTNFREMLFLYAYDRSPFLRVNFSDLAEPETAHRLWMALEKRQLENDTLLGLYYELARQPLDRSFLRDLKTWRQVLCNGFLKAQPDLALDLAAQYSQQLLDRLIFLRILESKGLHTYYSIPKHWAHWKSMTRNRSRFPFTDELGRIFRDVELDLNTELLKVNGVPPIPDAFVAAVVVPDEPIHASVQPFIADNDFRTIYGYDFNTLTDDAMGSVYEQYLAHKLQEGRPGEIIVTTDQTHRRGQGAYFTRPPVARFLTEASVGALVHPRLDRALALLDKGHYEDACAEMESIKESRVIDIACGSGTFLMQAFDVLASAYRQYNDAVQASAQRYGDLLGALEAGLKPVQDFQHHIATRQLFGIDKDEQAVEVARLNLWLKLLRAYPDLYARRNGASPRSQLPALSHNLLVANAVYPPVPLDFVPPGPRVIVGNPPWGADVGGSRDDLMDHYTLARGQFDSYEVFLERAAQALDDGDYIAYIIPDSIFQPQHAPTRRFVLDNFIITHIMRLGEGLFPEVYRAAAVVVARKGKAPEDHQVRASILVKADRALLCQPNSSVTVALLEQQRATSIRQKRFATNRDAVWDIHIREEDEPITGQMERRALNWKEIVISGRGVEIGKDGSVLRCPYCGTWNTMPRRSRSGDYRSKKCIADMCRKEFTVDEAGPPERIITDAPPRNRSASVIVGEALHRYRISRYRYIDLSRFSAFSVCPKCGSTNSIASRTKCLSCGQSYDSDKNVAVRRYGIDYKDPELFDGPKLLVRKTGRGIYAAIDLSGSYTTQVVYIFKLDPKRDAKYQGIRLEYLLGVLNSRAMLYYYYKRTAEIEWRSFPYVTQRVIQRLPIPEVDLENPTDRAVHDAIAARVQVMTERGAGPTEDEDQELETLVRSLYGIRGTEASIHIDNELKRIEALGTLLADPDEGEDEEVGEDGDTDAGD